MRPSGVITITTDFGHKGPFAAVMKGVILTRFLDAKIVDLAHDIPAQWPPEAGFWVSRSYQWFPQGSVHLAIVDPGVGTDREIVYVEIGTQRYVGPDNGLFTCLAARQSPRRIVAINEPALWLPVVTPTFHGRDIMAPVAARLALGAPINCIGERLGLESCVTISLAEPVLDKNGLTGEVVSIDHFGNIRTNIRRAHLASFEAPPQVILKSCIIKITTGSYGDISGDQAAALINSSNELEICVRNDNCARVLDVKVGDQIFVRDESRCNSAKDGV